MDKCISRKYFNNKAETWDQTIKNNDPYKLLAMLQRLNIAPGRKILDVGTGTGVFIPYLITALKGEGRIIGIDYAQNMLRKAKAKRFDGLVRFICAEVENIPLQNQTFDAVVCYSSFPHFHDKPKALLGIKRILKIGGAVYICHTASKNVINNIHLSIEDFQDHLLPDPKVMHQLLLQAGFHDIQIEEENESYLAIARNLTP